MTHNIIKTDNYLLVVDDSEIKVGDTVYYTIYGEDENGVPDTEPFRIGVDVVRDINVLGNLEFEMESLIALPKECKKIISHLPLNNSPLLEGVDLLPPLKDDETICPYPEEKQNAIDWHNGYTKAKEKYKYTEEDIRFAIKSAFMQGVERVPYLHQLEDNIIKALQQPKMPVAFECEEHQELCLNCEWQHNSCPNAEDCLKSKPKTITTPQGQTVWGGNL